MKVSRPASQSCGCRTWSLLLGRGSHRLRAPKGEFSIRDLVVLETQGREK